MKTMHYIGLHNIIPPGELFDEMDHFPPNESNMCLVRKAHRAEYFQM